MGEGLLEKADRRRSPDKGSRQRPDRRRSPDGPGQRFRTKTNGIRSPDEGSGRRPAGEGLSTKVLDEGPPMKAPTCEEGESGGG